MRKTAEQGEAKPGETVITKATKNAMGAANAITPASRDTEVDEHPWLPARWDKETDVVVVGYGAAGAVTAITVSEEGGRAIILEKAPEPGGTSMFEPMGGSAPKYMGKKMINPIATVAAVAMLLEQAGHPSAADRITRAIQIVTGTKMKSQAAGQMGYNTEEVGDLVVDAL